MGTMKLKENFTVTIDFVDGSVKAIDNVEELRLWTNKSDEPQYYILKISDIIIHIPFAAILQLTIKGCKDAIYVPDLYS